MQKIYLILRNNQQGGPYALDELVALSLKPYDLIWVEGRSAGWRYPTEIEALKPFVQTSAKETGSNPSPAETPGQRAKEPGNAPRTGHIYISIPGKSEKTMVKAEKPVAAPATDEEASLTEEGLEKKARELYQRVQAFAEKKEQGSPDGVETKYAKSLDDLKQEYSDWLHKKKRSRNKTPLVINKKALALTGLVAVVFLSGFIFARWMNNDAVKVQPLVENKVMSMKSESAQGAGTVRELEKKPSNTTLESEAGNEVEALTTNPIPEEVSAQKTSVPVQRNAAPRTKNNSSTASNQGEVASLIEKYTGQAVTTKTTPQPAEPPKEKVPLSQQVSMNGRYMKDNEKKNITGLEITVMNNSDEVVKSVAVKVAYHKKGGREFETEMVYVNNIHPHTPFTISRPGNKKAYSATFQIVQVQGKE